MTLSITTWRDVPSGQSLPMALFLSALQNHNVDVGRFEPLLAGSAATHDVELERVNRLVLALYRFEHMAHEMARAARIDDEAARDAELALLAERQQFYRDAETVADLQQDERTHRAVAGAWRLLVKSTDDAEATGHIMHRLLDMVATGIVKSRNADDVAEVAQLLKPLDEVIEGIMETVFAS